eukprot:scaffold11876_cov98-Skeletonema_dohrnii-CCMP3373.AAC.4
MTVTAIIYCLHNQRALALVGSRQLSSRLLALGRKGFCIHCSERSSTVEASYDERPPNTVSSAKR